jgi:hypothetical protein
VDLCPGLASELNAQVYIYIYIKVDCSINKVVDLCPGLAFTGEAGDRDVNKFFQIWVRGFS